MARPRLGFLLTTFYIAALALLAWSAGAPARVAGAPAAQEDQAIITAPPSNTQVAGLVQITGSAVHPQFRHYELAWMAGPITGESWAVFASAESQVENGVLGVWNTTQVPDGIYSLRLRVVRQDGNYSESFVQGLKVVNSQPTNTPTPLLGPTIPPEATRAPATPTPELIVQPPTSTPPPPTSTPASSGATGSETSGLFGPTSFNINLGALSGAFCKGVTYTLGAFILWGALLSVRGLTRWIVRRIVRRQANK